MLIKKLKIWISTPEKVFIGVGLVLGITSAILLPLFAGPDEGYHFYGSYATFSSDGNLPPEILVNPFSVIGDLDTGDYKEHFNEPIDFDDDQFGIAVNKKLTASPDGYINIPKVASITDISHLPQSVGILVGKMIHPSLGLMLILGRLFNLAFFIASIYFIIKYVRHAKWAFVFLALLPMVIHQAASLSYDVMNIVLIFAFIALMINLYTQKSTISRKQCSILVLLCIGLAITKPTNVILLSFLAFLPKPLYENTRVAKFISSKFSRHTLIVLGLVISVLVMALFTLYVSRYVAGHDLNLENLIKAILRTYIGNTNPELGPIVTTGIIGNFSWNYYRLPEWVVVVNFIAFTVILFRETIQPITRRLALLSMACLVIYVLGVTAAMYLTWTTLPYVLGDDAKYASGIQGRYFTPLLLLLVPVAAYFQKYIQVRAKDTTIALIVILISFFSLLYYLVATYYYFYI